jgi:hypothetical protein
MAPTARIDHRGYLQIHCFFNGAAPKSPGRRAQLCPQLKTNRKAPPPVPLWHRHPDDAEGFGLASETLHRQRTHAPQQSISLDRIDCEREQRRWDFDAKRLRGLEGSANSNLVGWLPITLLAISINPASAILARPSAPPSFAERGGLASHRQRFSAPWTHRTEHPRAPPLRPFPHKVHAHYQHRNAYQQYPT